MEIKRQTERTPMIKMWDMEKFTNVLRRLHLLAKKHFKIYGIETLFFFDGDFSMHAYYNEFPVEIKHENRWKENALMDVTHMTHRIHYDKEKDHFTKQTNFEGFNLNQAKLLKEEVDEE